MEKVITLFMYSLQINMEMFLCVTNDTNSVTYRYTMGIASVDLVRNNFIEGTGYVQIDYTNPSLKFGGLNEGLRLDVFLIFAPFEWITEGTVYHHNPVSVCGSAPVYTVVLRGQLQTRGGAQFK